MHRLQLSHRLHRVLQRLGARAKVILKFEVTDTFLFALSYCVRRQVKELDPRRDHGLMAQKLERLQSHRVLKPDSQVLGEVTKLARDPAATDTCAKLVISVDRTDAVGRVGRADLNDLVVEGHGADAVVLLPLVMASRDRTLIRMHLVTDSWRCTCGVHIS